MSLRVFPECQKFFHYSEKALRNYQLSGVLKMVEPETRVNSVFEGHHHLHHAGKVGTEAHAAITHIFYIGRG